MFGRDFQSNLSFLSKWFFVVWVVAALASIGLTTALVYIAYLAVQKL
jgi:hypothetical protein